jgi:carnitine O-acetyltransferase
MPRAEWAGWRDRLRRLDRANASALEEIETALFCLCLDDANPSGDAGACDQLLHGGSGNRWYDKSVSLIVLPDGRAGINVEHCELDGTTVLAFVDGLLGPEPEAGLEPAPVADAAPDAEPAPVLDTAPAHRPIDFVLDDELREAIRAAERSFTEFASATTSELVVFDDFGADVPKKLGMSPDAFVQLAYQLAHVRARGHVGATYESIATRQYRRGRTEAMRVVTPEIVRFTEAMSDPTADPGSRREAFRAAAEAHVARAKDCQEGRAPEQHLWELQWIARRAGGGYPAFFNSPGWTITRDDYLSTSSAPSANIEYFGFGSTASQCIGVAYVLLPERFTVYLSAPGAVGEQMRRFAAELRVAVAELVDLLTD